MKNNSKNSLCHGKNDSEIVVPFFANIINVFARKRFGPQILLENRFWTIDKFLLLNPQFNQYLAGETSSVNWNRPKLLIFQQPTIFAAKLNKVAGRPTPSQKYDKTA